jgi:branched-chain amino acid transport system substrate-binding protein
MLRRNFIQSLPTIVAAASSLSLISHARAQNVRDLDAYNFSCTAAMTGPLGSFGKNMKSGVDAAFAQINARGGVNGRKLAFEVMDDAYVPARSVENMKKILADKDILGLIGCLGTPNNAAITPMIEQTSIAHLAPLTGATSLRGADLRNLFHVRASYTDETSRLVKFLVSMSINNLAIVYLDNPYGKEVLADAVRALAEANIKAVAQVALATDGSNIQTVIASVLAAKPSAVLLGTAGAASTGVVAAIRKASTSMPIASISAALTQDGIKQLGVAAKGIGVTMVFPDADQAKLQLVREYQAAAKMSGLDNFSTGSLEGYVSGRIMAEAVLRAGKSASREKIRSSIASIRQYDLGGFPIDFGSRPYVASKFVNLGVMSAEGRLKG